MPPWMRRDEWEDVPRRVGFVDERRAEPAHRGVTRDPRPRNAAPMIRIVHGVSTMDAQAAARVCSTPLHLGLVVGFDSQEERKNLMPGLNGRRVASSQRPDAVHQSRHVAKDVRAVDLARYAARELIERTTSGRH